MLGFVFFSDLTRYGAAQYWSQYVFTIILPNFQSLFKVGLLFFSSWPLSLC